MGSAPQQADSPINVPQVNALARIFSNDAMNSPQLAQNAQDLFSAIQSPIQSQMQSQQPSGMAPPPQPQSSPAPQAQTGQSNMAPITQQLQQATQPGSSYVGQMQQPGFASDMQQPLQQYYQNPLAKMLGGWGNG